MADATPSLAKPRSPVRTITGWSILFLVILRILIGWHFFYEGIWKLMQDDWRATSYLVASSGPFRPVFQWLVPDVDGLEALDPDQALERMYARMDKRRDLAIEHYGLTEKQQEIYKAFVERKKHGLQDDKNVDALFANDAFHQALAEHREKVAQGEAGDRDKLLAFITPIFKDLDETVVAHLLPEQTRGRGPLPPVAIVPQGVQEPDSLFWLTERAKENAKNKLGRDLYDDEVKRLEKQYLYSLVDRRYDQIRDHYELPDLPDTATAEAKEKHRKLKAQAEEIHQSSYGWRYRDQKKIGGNRDKNCADALWADAGFQKQMEDYRKFLADLEELEEDPEPDYNLERMTYDYGKKAQMRADILARWEIPLNDLDPRKIETFGERMGIGETEDGQRFRLTEAQLERGPLPGEGSPTWWIDWSNMLGLTAVGACLMLGLFTRLAALGGIGLLMLYYFAMPPFPGLPENPMAEGHYLIVNKNLIEAVALLAIATSGVGRWAGLDAYFCAGARPKAKAKGKEPAPLPIDPERLTGAK